MDDETVGDVMTPDPLTLERTSTVFDAARAMKGADIGSVPVVDETGVLCGIVTDRDLVVRAIAEGCDPWTTTLGDICSDRPVCASADEPLEDAMHLMRTEALRRIPVTDADNKVIGIVSLGDLALDRDPQSVLAGISAAPPNS